MKPDIIRKLIDLNRVFYQTFALQFSSTRQHLQPGVHRTLDKLLPDLPLQSGILDLGCGNGELPLELARRGVQGNYIGLDFSTEMLAEARRHVADRERVHPDNSLTCSFLPASLGDPGWERALGDPGFPKMYQAIFAFAVLHHLPGEQLRRQVVTQIGRLLAPGGRFALSNWQFLNSARLRERIQPWEQTGITQDELDPGDFLLDWRQGGNGLRYAHHFSVEELAALAAQAGFSVEESFLSDGEGGKLGLYQVWRRQTPEV